MDETEPGTPPAEGEAGELSQPPRRRIVPLRLAPEAEDEPARDYVSPFPAEPQSSAQAWQRPEDPPDDPIVPTDPAAAAAVVTTFDGSSAEAEVQAPSSAGDRWIPGESLPPASEELQAVEAPAADAGDAMTTNNWWSTTGEPIAEAPAEDEPPAEAEVPSRFIVAAPVLAVEAVARPPSQPGDPYSIDSFWQQYDRSAGRVAAGAPAYRPPSGAAWPPVVSLPEGSAWVGGASGSGAAPPWGAPPLPVEFPEEKQRSRPWARELVETLLLALIIFLAVRSSVQNFRVDGSSMFPSLEDGEYLIVNKLIYARIDLDKLNDYLPFIDEGDEPVQYIFREPRRGDVIVFLDPNGSGRDFIKRVIGEPGDRIQIRDGGVYVNGLRLEEDYIQGRTQCPQTNRNCDLIVPDGYYYVMGDNRENSSDSRTFGAVDAELIIGRAMLTYWPLDKFGLAPNETFQIAVEEPEDADVPVEEATTAPSEATETASEE